MGLHTTTSTLSLSNLWQNSSISTTSTVTYLGSGSAALSTSVASPTCWNDGQVFAFSNGSFVCRASKSHLGAPRIALTFNITDRSLSQQDLAVRVLKAVATSLASRRLQAGAVSAPA